eukprot:9111826-Pyramimonas_sp.AAC.1
MGRARNWGLPWGPLWGNETLYWIGVTHASTATEASDGALPMGPRSAMLGGGGNACEHHHRGL